MPGLGADRSVCIHLSDPAFDAGRRTRSGIPSKQTRSRHSRRGVRPRALCGRKGGDLSPDHQVPPRLRIPRTPPTLRDRSDSTWQATAPRPPGGEPDEGEQTSSYRCRPCRVARGPARDGIFKDTTRRSHRRMAASEPLSTSAWDDKRVGTRRGSQGIGFVCSTVKGRHARGAWRAGRLGQEEAARPDRALADCVRTARPRWEQAAPFGKEPGTFTTAGRSSS